jgi:hypothetical protein
LREIISLGKNCYLRNIFSASAHINRGEAFNWSALVNASEKFNSAKAGCCHGEIVFAGADKLAREVR